MIKDLHILEYLHAVGVVGLVSRAGLHKEQHRRENQKVNEVNVDGHLESFSFVQLITELFCEVNP